MATSKHMPEDDNSAMEARYDAWLATNRIHNAAPKMLEALKLIASTLDIESYPENGSLESRLGKIARAAIASAEGISND